MPRVVGRTFMARLGLSGARDVTLCRPRDFQLCKLHRRQRDFQYYIFPAFLSLEGYNLLIWRRPIGPRAVLASHKTTENRASKPSRIHL